MFLQLNFKKPQTLDTSRGRKRREKGEEGKELPVSRHGQVETNISKQGLTSITIQVNGKTVVQFNRNRFKPEVANQSLGSEA